MLKSNMYFSGGCEFEKAQKKKRILRRLLFWAIVCLLLVSLYKSAFELEITDYSVQSAFLPPEFDGFRIVQLSDLHGRDFGDELYERWRRFRRI